MKIIFLKAYDFPFGGAPQNRLLGICRGLIEEGHEVEVHQYTPAKLNIRQNHLNYQEYKSVKIYNHAWRWSPIRSKYHQIIGIMEGGLKTIAAIIKNNYKSNIDYIFINSSKNAYTIPIYLLAKVIGAKLGRDLNEYPQNILISKHSDPLQENNNSNIKYKYFDVLFIITQNLISYYRPLLKKHARILHLPVTVDIDRFPNSVKDLSNNNIITYCGDLSQSKDGVMDLIKSFSIISEEFPDINLKLIGKNNDSYYMKSLTKLIADLYLSDRVVLTGYMNPDDIPVELYKSRLLVLSRPDNIQARGGFPTKLGEYLATGVPVVVTSVGELPHYLEDEKNAFMAISGDIGSFADAMRRALSNDKLSIQVGLAGRETALNYFSHEAQGKLISEFLHKVNHI